MTWFGTFVRLPCPDCLVIREAKELDGLSFLREPMYCSVA